MVIRQAGEPVDEATGLQVLKQLVEPKQTLSKNDKSQNKFTRESIKPWE